MEGLMDDKKKQLSDADITAEARTAPLAESELPDANVDAAGYCILTQDGEMARPDSGAPCDEGLDG